MRKPLLEAMTASDTDASVKIYDQYIKNGEDPWDIHLSLFPAVQPVQNPPYINPHLPKMYSIIRELVPYLNKEDLTPLVRLEIAEYARRPKLKIPNRPKTAEKNTSFKDIETVISYRDLERAAHYLDTFLEQKGAMDLCRNLLLLGSEYLNHSLGHSISCTAFILLEILNRPKDDPWPALVCLADYFCKGRFDSFSTPISSDQGYSEEAFVEELKRASAGYGIVNLHHTITLYAIERVRHLLPDDQYGKVLHAGVEFMGVKAPPPSVNIKPAVPSPSDYDQFYALFSKKEVPSLLPVILSMTLSDSHRKRLKRYLIKGVCDLYQGDYNPHYFTGLGSALWVVENYWNRRELISAVLDQYLNFFFQGV